MSIIKKLDKKGLLAGAPDWVTQSELEIIGGSTSYGVVGESSDVDVIAVCIPPKNHVFPHLNGRMPTSLPTLTINKDLNTIDDILNIEWDDIELTGYKAQPDFKDKPGMAI